MGVSQRTHMPAAAIPNKYKELIGLGVSGATRCRYCVYYHTEAAKLFGATDEEINEAAMVAKNTMGWSTYLNTSQFDYDRFTREFDQIAEHVRRRWPRRSKSSKAAGDESRGRASGPVLVFEAAPRRVVVAEHPGQQRPRLGGSIRVVLHEVERHPAGGD